MSRLILGFIRHADYQQLANTPSAHQPFALNEKGRLQAQQEANKLCQFLEQAQWQLHSEMECSQMLRAWQTADIFRETLLSNNHEKLVINSYDALAERSVGAVANLDVEQITDLVNADPRLEALPAGWKADSYFRLPFQGAESLMQAGERVAKHLQHQMSALQRRAYPQVKLVFGHGASFRHAAFHLGVLKEDDIAKLSMYHAQPIFLEWLEDGRWQHIAGEWKHRKLKTDGLD